ncbi:MAG: hypothetical protein M3O35_09390 [Acidobacteriota bacterium]|nr:hypothetical protein [Acidobacteriota bacterium]
MWKLPIGIITLFGALALNAQPQKMLTGAHFPATGDFKTLKNLGYDFAVITLDPHNSASWKPALDAAEQAGIKLMVGGYPPPYLYDNVKWTITGSGMELLAYLQSRSSLILALYVFNEPYSTNPYGSDVTPCGYFSASDLRALRNTIQGYWPGVKIYQDLGEPSDWAPGSAYTKSTPCVGNKYADQTGVADYVGIWYYPFTSAGYDRAGGLTALRREANFVLNSMQPAVPMSLNQAFACSGCNLILPPLDQMLDWNCATRSLPLAALSWYPWRKFASYEGAIADVTSYWPLSTAESCSAGIGAAAVGLSAASGIPFVAPNSFVSVYGVNLASGTQAAQSQPLPMSLAGLTLQVRDAAGQTQLAPLAYVSPGQINFLIPGGMSPGQAALTLTNGNTTLSGTALIRNVAPALFTADGSGHGVAAAAAIRVAGTNQSAITVFECGGGKCSSVPIDLAADGSVYLTLYGTGIRNHAGDVQCAINGLSVAVPYAGAQGQYAGLDQINVGPIPVGLRGSGETDLVLTVDGQTTNAARVNFR